MRNNFLKLLLVLGVVSALPVELRSRVGVYDMNWVESTLRAMTLQEKIGQLFIVAAVSDEDQKNIYDFMQRSPYTMDKAYVSRLITDYHVGGVIFLGNGSTPEKQIEVTGAFQKLSKTPLMIALDAEWGLSMRLKEVMVFPRNNVLGNLHDFELVYLMGKEVGRELALIGVHMNLAPVIDVNNNPDNPIIGTRSFGDDPDLVAQNGIAYMRGLTDAGILSCAKHFPGHGDTKSDSHLILPVISHDRDRLNQIELYPFVQLIKNGVPAIMTAHLAVPALELDVRIPTSFSYNCVINLLKNELQFSGLVITDGLGMAGAVMHCPLAELELRALLAGNDILLCPLDVPNAVERIEQAIYDGVFSEQELDKRVFKILCAKAWAFSNHPESLNPVYDYDQLHTPEACALQSRLCQ